MKKHHMMFRALGESLMVVRQDAQSSTDAEWRAFLAELVTQQFEKLRVLIVTDGGGPTSEQRAELKVAMAGRAARTAVISDSIKVRFTIAMIALINPQHHGFASHEIGQAFDFLDLSAAERARVTDAVRDLGARLTEL